jgi:hypothetical protein
VKDSSAPQAPNPEVTIPLQGAENRKTFDYQLDQMRTNTQGPTGSVSWSKTPTFDQAGFDKAMQDWRESAISSPAPAPGVGAGYWRPGGDGGADVWVASDDGPGVTQPGAPAGYSSAQPSRDAFTTYDWTQTTTLSPEQQAIFDATQKSQLGTANLLDSMTGQVSDAMSSPMDWGGLPDLATGLGADTGLGGELSGYRSQISGLDPAAFNQQLSDAMYGSSTRYLDEQRKTERQALESRLADQGFVPGTPGYAQAMDQFSQAGERAYADARDRSVIGGTSAGSTAFGNKLSALQAAMSGALSGSNALFGQRQQSQQAQNQARMQAISEALQQRSQPLNELNAIRSGQQIGMPQGAGTSQTPNLQAPDLLGQFGQQYEGQLAAANANAASNNSTVGAGASLIAAYMMF